MKSRGRPKGSKNKTVKHKAFIRRIKKEGRGKAFLTLICKKCKKEFRIRVNNIDIYTEEIKKNWVCLLCKSKLKRKRK